MPTTPEAVFQYEVQKSGDENAGSVTTITCHGRLVSEKSGQVKQSLKPHISMGRRIVLDLTDVSYSDNSGRAPWVGLKIFALNDGFCRLELFNPPLRGAKNRGVKKPSRLSTLTQLFSTQLFSS